jgi:hypothetical protein
VSGRSEGTWLLWVLGLLVLVLVVVRFAIPARPRSEYIAVSGQPGRVAGLKDAPDTGYVVWIDSGEVAWVPTMDGVDLHWVDAHHLTVDVPAGLEVKRFRPRVGDVEVSLTRHMMSAPGDRPEAQSSVQPADERDSVRVVSHK